MRVHVSTGIVILVMLAACGGRDTVASKSAAAYRDAQAKGQPVGGGHGHEEAAGSVDHAAAGHATPPAEAGATSLNHAAMGHASPAEHRDHGSTTAHQGHDSTQQSAHAGHTQTGSSSASAHEGHTQPESGHDAHAPASAHAQHAQQGAAAAPHAQHGAMHHGAAPVVSLDVDAPTSNKEIAETQPAATLRADEYDAPAPIAVEEAAKAEGGHGGHRP